MEEGRNGRGSNSRGLEQRIKEVCQRRVRYGACSRDAPTRGLADQSEEDPTHLSRVSPAITQHNAKAQGEGPSFGMTVGRRHDRTRPWAMDFVHDQLATGQKLRVPP